MLHDTSSRLRRFDIHFSFNEGKHVGAEIEFKEALELQPDSEKPRGPSHNEPRAGARFDDTLLLCGRRHDFDAHKGDGLAGRAPRLTFPLPLSKRKRRASHVHLAAEREL